MAKFVTEAVVLVSYYGWRRVWQGLGTIRELPQPELWKAIIEARKRHEDAAARESPL